MIRLAIVVGLAVGVLMPTAADKASALGVGYWAEADFQNQYSTVHVRTVPEGIRRRVVVTYHHLSSGSKCTASALVAEAQFKADLLLANATLRPATDMKCLREDGNTEFTISASFQVTWTATGSFGPAGLVGVGRPGAATTNWTPTVTFTRAMIGLGVV